MRIDPGVLTDPSIGYIDPVGKKIVVIPVDVLSRQWTKYAPEIAKTFDRHFADDVLTISREYAKLMRLLHHASTQIDSDKQRKMHMLLMNTATTLHAAIDLIRTGYRLQPGILLRNVVESMATVIVLCIEPGEFEQFEAGKFESSKAFTRAKKVLPPLGPINGMLSNHFVHLGDLHASPQPVIIYNPEDEAAHAQLTFVRGIINLLYITSELAFSGYGIERRYWRDVPGGGITYDPDDEERQWQKEFLRIEEEELGIPT